MPEDRDKEGRPKPDYSRGYYDREGRWVEYRDIGRTIRDEIHNAASLPRRHGPGTQGVLFAVIMIAIGVFLFLDNIGLFHFRDIWRFWPVALIAIGASKLLDTRGIGGQVWSLMWIVIGTAFLLDNLGLWHMRWNVIWPLGLVAFGIMTLINAMERQNRGPQGPIAGTSRGTSTDSTLHEWATFGGIKRRVDTQDFQGGEMIAVFGGIEIDLRRAVIPPGKEVFIDANATFGGIELRVPENWIVVVRGIGVFGGYEDKTIPPRESDRATAPRLVIKGYAVFGGVSVQN